MRCGGVDGLDDRFHAVTLAATSRTVNRTDDTFIRLLDKVDTMSARRTPDPDERQRDPERTRRALLGAARVEFADKGLAGARVNEIA